MTETAAATSVLTPTEHRRATTPELQLPVVLGSRYKLVESRGGGGMAKVYRALDLTLEREVAVKLMNAELRQDPEFDSRFHREARIASQLADPHIVVVHDFGIDPAHGPFLVMEFLQGFSLRERLQAQGPMPLKPALQLSSQLLLALIHAHDKGIVHRDIKPDNIFLLNQSGVRLHVRVLDFGIARIYRRDEPSSADTSLTRPGAVLGTPRYMSPEQLAGQPLDARSDLYSAALVIYEALTGTLPYVSHKKLTELCPDAPVALQEILNRCLQQNPAERPASAIDVYLAMQEPCKASGVLLLPPGAMDRLAAAARAGQGTTQEYQPPPPPPSRRRLYLALLALVVLGLGIWGVIALLKGLGKTKPQQESLLNLTTESSLYDLAKQFEGRDPDGKWPAGNPWNSTAATALGHVLEPSDLGNEAAIEKLEVRTWSSNQVCAVIEHEQLRALIVHEPYRARTGRGLKLGSTVQDLVDKYQEEPSKVEVVHVDRSQGKAAHHIEVRRYDTLGIGFEVQDGKVKGITIYPPKP